jgi:hypothetical protein
LLAAPKTRASRVDYEAAPPTTEEAAEYVDGAAEFIAEIERLLTADKPTQDNT